MASGDVVKLNIGGKVFRTTRSTLTKYDGFFRMMFESAIPLTLDESGCIFIDRSPKNFDLVLNFLRDGDTPIPESEFHKCQLLKEAEYYTLDGLIHMCGGEPSEEWKKINLDTKFMRDWRGANLRAEIQLAADWEEFRDFNRYCRDKLGLQLAYSVSAWGDIHENPFILKFVQKYSGTWNILFFHLKDHSPRFFIHQSMDRIIDGSAPLMRIATCEEYMKRGQRYTADEQKEFYQLFHYLDLGKKKRAACHHQDPLCKKLDFEPRWACSNCRKEDLPSSLIDVEKLCLICQVHQQVSGKLPVFGKVFFSDQDLKRIADWKAMEASEKKPVSRQKFEEHLEELEDELYDKHEDRKMTDEEWEYIRRRR